MFLHTDLGAFEMQCQCCVDHVLRKLPKQEWKLVCWRIQMIRKDRVVDGVKSILTREADCKGCKVSLKSWIDCEGSCCWVHGRDVLAAVNVLLCKLVSVVPIRN